MKDQLLRASSRVALNLSEGNVRKSQKDRLKFFNIAYSSVKEIQTICELENLQILGKQADLCGAMIFSLNRKLTDTVSFFMSQFGPKLLQR